MLAIRMQRKGRAHYPTYRIVVQESQRHPLSGRIVAEVGNYNPATKQLCLNKELVEKYLNNGAQPSSRVAYILKKSKVELPKWYKEKAQKHAEPKHADKLRKNQPKEEAVEEVAEAIETGAPETEVPAEVATEATTAKAEAAAAETEATATEATETAAEEAKTEETAE